MSLSTQRAKYGFSLVELSIVLVILGLLVGGVLAGQSLIRAAELRSVSADIQRYSAALHTFRDKYLGWPGDLSNATQFWGTASGGCPNGAGSGTQTCNGDGDGVIDNSTGIFHEGVRGWQHLALAGLIEGTFTGVQPASPWIIIGTNVPRMRISNGGFSLVSFGQQYGGAFCDPALTDPTNMCWPNQSAAIALFGGVVASDSTRNQILRPEELWNIDTKLDDTRPNSGIIQSGFTGMAPPCTATVVAPVSYNLASNTISCNIIAVINR